MIRNQWYAILESHEVKPGKLIGVIRLGERLAIWRERSGELACLVDQCPHRGAALSLGKLHGDGLQCPFHGFEFDANGACQLVPANGKNAAPPKALKAHSHPLREAHGLIYLWWGEPRPEYPPIPYFEALTDDFVYSSQRDQWNIHYSRAIENQLDAIHLPFIHHNTIGRGNRTLVNGPIVKERSQYPGDHLLELWVHNEVDEGQTPLKASQMPEPSRHASLQFRFPNVWHNWISDDLRVFIAFAPIDDEHTLMYLRYYHKLKTPILRQVVGFFGGLANLVIERQDKRVVVTQRPMHSDLDSGEILVPGDGPIIAYRKARRALIEANT